VRTPLLHAFILAVSIPAFASCSKSAGEHIYEATTAVSSKVLSNLVEKDASHQVAGLIAQLKSGPGCDVYRRRLAEAGKGPPADGATQHAIVWTFKQAGEADCVAGP
jgi:hypothetical protein